MLTVANVVMVAIGSALMFRAKEVLPVKKKVFWSDLKVSQSLMCIWNLVFFINASSTTLLFFI